MTAILVGNPNVGKSALFGALTGHYVTVSNYPGTTVEVTRGTWGKRIILDTPGANGLSPMSEDEQVTRDIVLAEKGATVIQVVDAKNLLRGLSMTAQLAELEVPMVLVLNMADEAAPRGISIDVPRLQRELGVPIVETVAVQRRGLAKLSAIFPEAKPSTLRVQYDERIEQIIAGRQRGRALLALSSDGEELAAERRALSVRESPRLTIARQRLAAVQKLVESVMTQKNTGVSALKRVGDFSVHPVWGVPVLIAVLAVAYVFVGWLGAKIAVDFLEGIFKDVLVPLVARVLPFDLIVGPYGLFSMGLSYGVAIVLPIVTTFFFAFSILEDSGYLPRLASMLNRLFRAMGLNGKAVLPLILGLGCDTMATLTARILETRKERIIVTVLLALAIPCSAQLAVVLAMLANVPFAASLWYVSAVVLVMVLIGWLAAKVIPGRGSDFILELPPLRVPQLSNVLVKTVARIEWYAKEALPLFVVGTFVLWGLDKLGALVVLEKAAAPVVVGMLGLPREAAAGFILGFLRRDYAAAGLFASLRNSTLTHEQEIQIVVALTTVTLFIPCIAQLFMMIKERGARTAVAIVAFILPFAFGVGALMNLLMRRFY